MPQVFKVENHFARQCKTGKVATVEITDAPSETGSDDDFYIETVSSNNRAHNFPEQAFVEIKVGPKQVPINVNLIQVQGLRYYL